MPDNKGLGWIPDIPSFKDYTETTPEISTLLTKTRLSNRVGGSHTTTRKGGSATGSGGAGAAAAPAIAAMVDLRPFCSPIEDQGSVGSCTANAAVGLVEYMERRASGRSIDASRLFVYKATRNLLNWHGDTGAYIRTTMEALVLFGAPPEAYWPYNGAPSEVNAQLDAEPTAFCYAIADSFKTVRYMKLDSRGTPLNTVLDNIRNYLNAGFAAMFGLPVYNEFDTPTAAGDIAFPSPTSHSRGGHAICAVGYDDNRMIGADKGALLVRNSWGTGWGLNGYAWLSYKYVTSGLATDWWSIISQNWVDTGQFS